MKLDMCVCVDCRIHKIVRCAEFVQEELWFRSKPLQNLADILSAAIFEKNFEKTSLNLAVTLFGKSFLIDQNYHTHMSSFILFPEK